MKIIKDNCKEKIKKVICYYCKSEIELNENDISNCYVPARGMNYLVGKHYICPCCNKRNMLDKNANMFSF